MIVRCSRPMEAFNMLDSIFNDSIFNEFKNSPTPEYDIKESEDGFGVEFMLPGFKKEDISVDVDDKVLTIEGERNAQEETTYNRKGSFYGKFKKSFELPDDVLADQINASFKRGILSLDIPKDKESKLSKTIVIK